MALYKTNLKTWVLALHKVEHSFGEYQVIMTTNAPNSCIVLQTIFATSTKDVEKKYLFLLLKRVDRAFSIKKHSIKGL